MIKPKTSGRTWIGKYHIYMYKLEKVGLNKKKFQSIAKEFEFIIYHVLLLPHTEAELQYMYNKHACWTNLQWMLGYTS